MYEASFFGGGKVQKPKKQNLVEEDDAAPDEGGNADGAAKQGGEGGEKKVVKIIQVKGVETRIHEKLKREFEGLQKRQTVLLSTHKIEQEQAKRHAKQIGEDMIAQRLNACTEIYESEFEVLAKQFEKLKNEVDVQRIRENDLRRKLADQEAVNTQLNNFIESIGYDLMQGDKERSLTRKIKEYEGTTADDILETVIQIQDDPDLVPEDVVKIIDEGNTLLD